MTKKFEEFLNQTNSKTPEPEGIEVDAGLACQICFAQTDEPAIWNPEKKTLTWNCPEGHKSSIKDFKGF
jgi:hypothetical protein